MPIIGYFFLFSFFFKFAIDYNIKSINRIQLAWPQKAGESNAKNRLNQTENKAKKITPKNSYKKKQQKSNKLE